MESDLLIEQRVDYGTELKIILYFKIVISTACLTAYKRN